MSFRMFVKGKAQQEEVNEPEPRTIHIFENGVVLCDFSKKPPTQWPKGHTWVGAKQEDVVTCSKCRDELKRLKRSGHEIGWLDKSH